MIDFKYEEFADAVFISISYDSKELLRDEELEREILEWCKLNFPNVRISDGGHHITQNRYYKYIHRLSDDEIMAFKLRWE